MKIRRNLKTILFLTFLAGMGILGFVLPDKTESLLEGKTLIELPRRAGWDGVNSAEYTNEMELYIGQQLAGRDTFLGIGTDIQRILGRKVINNVVIANDGSYATITSVPDDLTQCEEKILNVKKALDNQDIPLFFAVAGSKYNIYEDAELPYFKTGSNTRASTSNFMESLSAEGVQTIYLYDCLKEMTLDGESPYYRTDHHWNSEGAFVGYTEIANLLFGGGVISKKAYEKEDFYLWKDNHRFYGSALRAIGGTVLWNSDYDMIQQYLPIEGDYSYEHNYSGVREGTSEVFVFPDKYDGGKYQNYYNFISGGSTGESVFCNESNMNGETLVVFGDSFSQSLLPMLIKNFKCIYYFDVRQYSDSISEYAKDVNADGVLILFSHLADDRFKELNP